MDVDSRDPEPELSVHGRHRVSRLPLPGGPPSPRWHRLHVESRGPRDGLFPALFSHSAR